MGRANLEKFLPLYQGWGQTYFTEGCGSVAAWMVRSLLRYHRLCLATGETSYWVTEKHARKLLACVLEGEATGCGNDEACWGATATFYEATTEWMVKSDWKSAWRDNGKTPKKRIILCIIECIASWGKQEDWIITWTYNKNEKQFWWNSEGKPLCEGNLCVEIWKMWMNQGIEKWEIKD